LQGSGQGAAGGATCAQEVKLVGEFLRPPSAA